MIHLSDWPIGAIKQIGTKMYTRCAACGQIVCMNKWLFGSLHLCKTEEAINQIKPPPE